jgi:hypothetical protein
MAFAARSDVTGSMLTKPVDIVEDEPVPCFLFIFLGAP